MQTYKNNKSIIISIVVLIVIGAGIYYYKYHSIKEAAPVGCAEGYKFNILTGKPCPAETSISSGMDSSVAATSTSN